MDKTISLDDARKQKWFDKDGKRVRLKRVSKPKPKVEPEPVKVPEKVVEPKVTPIINVPEPKVSIVQKDWSELDVEVTRGQDGLISGFRITRVK